MAPRVTRASRSAVVCSASCGSGLASLKPKPALSQAQTRVVRARVACTGSQPKVVSLNPAVKTTVGDPSPRQR